MDEEAPIKQEDYWENENDRSDLPENTEDYKEEPMVTDVDNRDGELRKYFIYVLLYDKNEFVLISPKMSKFFKTCLNLSKPVPTCPMITKRNQ